MSPKSAPPFAALLLLILAGCGGTSFTPPSKPIVPPTPVTPSVLGALPGDWLAFGLPPATTTPILTTPIASFSGAITVSGTTITAVFRALAPQQPSGCPSINTALPFTGTLDAANNLTLTGLLSSGVATITATLSQNLNTYTAGSYQIIGGTCSMSSVPMQLVQFAPTNGTYAGTFNAMDTSKTVIPGTATAITAILTQSTTPGADGKFPLSGTVTATGACIGRFSFVNGSVSGGGFYVPYSALNTPPEGEFSGTSSPDATTFRGGFSLFSACANVLYLGTLTRQ